jgi:hypothetical protein
MMLGTKLFEKVPDLSHLPIAGRHAEEARRFAQEALDAAWLLSLVAAATVPVVLRSVVGAWVRPPRHLRHMLPRSV